MVYCVNLRQQKVVRWEWGCRWEQRVLTNGCRDSCNREAVRIPIFSHAREYVCLQMTLISSNNETGVPGCQSFSSTIVLNWTYTVKTSTLQSPFFWLLLIAALAAVSYGGRNLWRSALELKQAVRNPEFFDVGDQMMTGVDAAVDAVGSQSRIHLRRSRYSLLQEFRSVRCLYQPVRPGSHRRFPLSTPNGKLSLQI